MANSVQNALSWTAGAPNMAIARINKRGQVTIPSAVRSAANLREGDSVQLEVTAEGVLMRSGPKRDPEQWWFWEKEWLDGELEIDARRAANPGTANWMTEEEFMAWLNDNVDNPVTGTST